MKKAVVLLLFAFSISFVNAQKSEGTTMLEKLNLKPIEFVMDEQAGKIDKETKALRVNLNEYFKQETLEEANTIALFYLQKKQNVYGLSNDLNNIKVVKTTESKSGKYVYCQQYMNNIPVFATNFTVYINKEDFVTYALNEFRNIAKYKDIKSQPSINDNNALQIAKEYLKIKGDLIDEPKTELVYFESIDNGLELAWKVNIVVIEKPIGDWQVFVSASDGHIIHVEDIRLSIYVDGSGKVFRPNPLVSANVSYGGNYVHNGGATNPYLESQQFQVTLKDLTYENNLYKLKGPYCEVKNIGYYNPTIIPELPTSYFNFARNQEQFGAVMCYYYVDLGARRILELGYNIPNGLQYFKIDPHGEPNKDAHYWASGNYITMGSGWFDGNTFVPACEESDVILHEYGHAMQYNLGAGNVSTTPENVSIKEGSSDYWATSYKRSLYPNNWAELGLWFGEGVPARRTDLYLIYPTDYVSGHKGGRIWSSALMKIWGDLGRDITDKLFLETHFLWGLSPNMQDAATAFMKADLNLYNGSHLCQIYSRFQEHGLIDANQIIKTTSFVNQTVSTNKIVFSCSDLDVQNVTITNGATLTLNATGDINVREVYVVNNSKLILDAVGEVTLERDFEVELGSELEIK